EQGARAALAERPPNEAEIPLDTLAETPFPKLVLSGAHSAAFDAVCDVLEETLNAERAVLPGAGHSLPRAPGYNETLTAFIERAGVAGRVTRAGPRLGRERAVGCVGARDRRARRRLRPPLRRRF